MVLWRSRQAIVLKNLDCDYNLGLYRMELGYCGESIRHTQIKEILWIHYDEGVISNNKMNAYFNILRNEDEAVEEEDYARQLIQSQIVNLSSTESHQEE